MTEPLLKGMEEVVIPVRDPKTSAKWYKEKLGCKLIYFENKSAGLRIETGTFICLLRTSNHQSMKDDKNEEYVKKYYNFYPEDVEKTYKLLVERGVKVNPIDGDLDMKYFTFFDPDGNLLVAIESH